jgi:endonuclease/exonuclease/phosphatase family metal-dependent hydrolase
LDVTVLALQELDVGLDRTGRQNQPALLAGALGMHVYFGAALSRGHASYGNALLSAAPIEATTLELPGRSEPRSCIVAVTAGWSMAATHLGLDRDESAAQLAAVVDALCGLPPPRLLLGDLNREPGELDAATARGFRSAGVAATHPSWRPRRQIDHILHQEDVESAGVHAPRLAVSDHRPLVAELRLLQETATISTVNVPPGAS